MVSNQQGVIQINLTASHSGLVNNLGLQGINLQSIALTRKEMYCYVNLKGIISLLLYFGLTKTEHDKWITALARLPNIVT